MTAKAAVTHPVVALKEPPWLTIARSQIDVAEIEGPKSNSKIVRYAKEAAGVDAPDSDAWCASFVGSMLFRDGLAETVGTGKRNARSYSTDNVHFDKLDAARLGCIVVFWRGSPGGWQGHVAFFIKEDATHIWTLGGNQSNRVSIARYPKKQLIGYYWPKGRDLPAPPAEADPQLVRVQKRLKELGYHDVGSPDGKMGSKTRGAILAFKADWNERHEGTTADLPLNATIDQATLAALMDAPVRAVSADRATATSATIGEFAAVKETKKIGWLARAAGVIGIGGVGKASGVSNLLDKAEGVSSLYQRAYDLVAPFLSLIISLWPFLLIGGAIAVYLWQRRIRREEVLSYRMGETNGEASGE